MTDAARRIVETFEALPEEDRQTVVVEILRRTAADVYPALEDKDLVLAAEQVFLELDRREQEE